MQTRHDLEFMAAMLGIVDSTCVCPWGRHVLDSPTLLAERVADYMRDPVANVLARSGILDLLCALPDGECRPGPTPTRGDLEFMADCLSTVEQRTIGGFPDMRPRQRYGYLSTAYLARAIAEYMADPVANARAQDRIADLLCELPPAGYYAPARYERPRPPFREPAEPARGLDAQTVPCAHCPHTARYHANKGLEPRGKCDPWYTGDRCDCPGFEPRTSGAHDLPAPLRQSKQPVESILTSRGFITV